MVSAVHGTLLECDVPVKQFILHINDELPPSERFVISDLDATHLLVQPGVSLSRDTSDARNLSLYSY